MVTAEFYAQLSRTLVDVAMGRTPADMVIRKGRWVSVQSGEIIPGTDVAVKNGRIAFVGSDASHTLSKTTKVIEAEDRYMVPGLLDGHMHVESGMITVTEFVRAVAPRGTTGMFVDPHEIVNVFGLRGIRLMVEEAAVQPIHVWVQIPSCVPSAPGLETPGASLGPHEIAEALGWEGVIGLGEMMNFPGVFSGDEKMHTEMAEARRAGKVVGGHYASPDLGLPFHGYVAGGPEDDHEGTRLEDAIVRLRQGMKPMLRLGSSWHDIAAQVRAITELKLDSRHFLLVTDDSHSETLINDGHMDRVLRYTIAQGVPPVTAVQMMTLNTATHFGVARNIGMIAPGRYADIIISRDLPEFKAEMVIVKGQIVAEDGQLVVDLPAFLYPDWVTHSVHLKRSLNAEDFRLKAPNKPKIKANIIGIIENQAPTRHMRMEVAIENEEVNASFTKDLAKIALIERHHGTGEIQIGLVNGFGFSVPCAIGSTVAHDSHHMLVVGTNDVDMALAANELARINGGQVVVNEGKIIGQVDLPIAGLMSNENARAVAKKAASVLDGFRACGCTLNNPNMQLSLLALVVIPELRISNKGLVDVTKFSFIPLFDE